jgi:hypothetical protein
MLRHVRCIAFSVIFANFIVGIRKGNIWIVMSSALLNNDFESWEDGSNLGREEIYL